MIIKFVCVCVCNSGNLLPVATVCEGQVAVAGVGTEGSMLVQSVWV